MIFQRLIHALSEVASASTCQVDKRHRQRLSTKAVMLPGARIRSTSYLYARGSPRHTHWQVWQAVSQLTRIRSRVAAAAAAYAPSTPHGVRGTLRVRATLKN